MGTARRERNLLWAIWGALAVLVVAFFATEERPAASAQSLRLLAFGDSLTHGYGLPAGDTFPERLEVALRERGWQVTVLNGGNSGETTAGGRARLDWALADGPDAVILELGANDALRGLSPEATYDNLDAILRRLRGEGLPVLLAGMVAPPNLGPEYVAEFNRIYPDLAERHGALLYPFFLKGVALRPGLNQGDGIHPNAEGVAVIVENILPEVEKLLSQAVETRQP